VSVTCLSRECTFSLLSREIVPDAERIGPLPQCKVLPTTRPSTTNATLEVMFKGLFVISNFHRVLMNSGSVQLPSSTVYAHWAVYHIFSLMPGHQI